MARRGSTKTPVGKGALPVSKQPKYLVLVINMNGLDSLSAHVDRESAESMFNWLHDLLAGSPSKVSIVEVPEKEGVVKFEQPASVDPTPFIPTIVEPVETSSRVRTPMSQEDFQEETRRMIVETEELTPREADASADDQGTRS